MLTIPITMPLMRAQMEILRSHDTLQERAEREAQSFRVELESGKEGTSDGRRESGNSDSALRRQDAAVPADTGVVEAAPYGAPRLLNVLV